jgi:acetyl-CoA decarbonylase/synthase complex subunit delta
MPDMADAAQADAAGPAPVTDADQADEAARAPGAAPLGEAADGDGNGSLSPARLAALKAEITAEIRDNLKEELTREIVGEIIGSLGERFLGTSAGMPAVEPAERPPAEPAAPSARDRLAAVTAFEIPRETHETAVWTATLGATKAAGGTRGRTVQVGGATCMPFHLWEGAMPHRPVVAMEVFDAVSEKYPPVLRGIYGDLLGDPAAMAASCVERYGADLISVRLEGTHPEKGGRDPEQAVQVVESVLAAVDVPVIVTGHSHFETVNEVMKEVAGACAGENLLLNWVEQDNYRTIAGAALAYGHSVVTQSPIDVNLAKQLNILLSTMGVPPEKIVMDPMTGALGYGLEYTYSVMERIRLTGLGGDRMLAGPMIVAPGQECVKLKELKATEADFPAWGELRQRAALWELATATSLLYAGADILIMYHPEAVAAVKQTIDRLLDEPVRDPAHAPER